MSDYPKVFVIGAGGHAKVVISALLASGFDVGGVYDDDESKRGDKLLGIPVRGLTSEIGRMDEAFAVIAVGNNAARKRIAERLSRLKWATAVHPRAYVHESVRLGGGTVVFAGATIQPDTKIGAGVIVNTGATIDHDCMIGDFAHIAPGAHLAGGVRVGEGAFLGIGSAIIPNVRVGAWATIGAGATVIRDVPDNAVAVGVPAKAKHGESR